ncbi:MAG TPA: type I methionyl aminopeptidase [Candidatus Limnocylindria bacterium]|nr:type I methionyl aminopeptidase [Candidatus Limnocylindria bacterium]
MVTIKSAAEVAKMREAGKVVAEILAATSAAAKPGVTTGELDRIAREIIERRGAASNFLDYQPSPHVNPYPGTICTSVNSEVVHGIPSARRKLKDGDVLAIDAGAIVDGWHADAAITVAVGTPSEKVTRLIAVTREALRRAIAAARVGARLGDIGHAVQSYVEGEGYGVVRHYGGHGIGRAMHEDPHVPNLGTPDRGAPIREGMCLALEPMVNVGRPETRVLADGWTVVSEDSSLSAHFEHTIWCTSEGPVVLTDPGSGADERIGRELGTLRRVPA